MTGPVRPDGVPYFRHLRTSERAACGGRLRVFDSRVVLLRDVVVDFNRCAGRPGGEPLAEVQGQSEAEEMYRFSRGFLTLADAVPGARAPMSHPWLQDIFSTLVVRRGAVPAAVREPRPLTLLVVRYGYANLFHSMTDLYNAYLVRALLVGERMPLRVILADGHPASPLDDAWRVLYRDVSRIGAWTGRHRFPALALGPVGVDSPLEMTEQPTLPLVERFRRFVLRAHGVAERRAASRGRAAVTVVLRRDYRAHPRATGTIRRKIADEAALLEGIRRSRLGARLAVRGVVLERLSMADQLRLIHATDVLVGMHGAGLTHTLFLPPGAGLVELFPAYHSPATRYFRRMAECRGLFYQGWQNTDARREKPGHRTVIPSAVVVEAIARYLRRAG